MEGSLLAHSLLIPILLLYFSTLINSSSTTRLPPKNTNTEYIKTSCTTTMYPKLCYRSLSIYASKIQSNPKLLTDTALNVSLTATKSTSRLMRKVSKVHGLQPREVAAIQDCVELVGDSVYELRRSIREMEHARGENFAKLMSDVETWVSAALTDDTTCLDGLGEAAINGNVEIIVRRHLVKIAHLTSNALALVNCYASAQANSP